MVAEQPQGRGADIIMQSGGGWGDATGKLALPLCIIFAVFEVEREIPNKEGLLPAVRTKVEGPRLASLA